MIIFEVVIFIILFFSIQQKGFLFLGLLFFFVYIITFLPSIFFLSTGSYYAPELQKFVGDDTHRYAIWILIYILVTIIYVSKLIFRKAIVTKINYNFSNSKLKVVTIYKLNLNKIILFIYFAIIMFLIITTFLSPFPLLSGIDRNIYYELYGGIRIFLFYKFINLIGIYLGLFYITTFDSNMKRLTLFLFILTLVELVLLGNKFSTPLNFIVFFLLPFSILYMHKQIISVKVFYYTLIYTLIFFIIFYYMMTIYLGDAEFIDYLVDRVLIAQSQLYWLSVDKYFVNDNWSFDCFTQAIDKIYINTLFNYHGNRELLYLMYLDTPISQIIARLEVGYMYTGAFPTILITIFGPYMFPVVLFILVYVYIYSLKIFLYLISLGYFYSVIIFSYIITNFAFLFVTGTFGTFKMWVIKILLFIVIYIFERKIHEKN